MAVQRRIPALKPHFDISGDLDTPVSAFMKLAAFPAPLSAGKASKAASASRATPSSALASASRSNWTGTACASAASAGRCRKTARSCSRLCARAGPLAPPGARHSGRALAGGLVGYASYDIVRFFEKLPPRSALDSAFRFWHYAATKSLLVVRSPHRGIALLHDGSEVERQALRKEVIQALRGALPNGRHAGKYSRPEAGLSAPITWPA